MAYDLLIKGGQVIDGSGLPGFRGDVAIKGDRIAAVGRVPGPAHRVIDADGLVVAPGFIDHHTHMDAQIFWDPTASASASHGVTTIVMGNCGLTFAPCRPDGHEGALQTFIRVEAMSRQVLETGIPWGWESFGEYLGTAGRRLGVNVACLVGHNAIRQYVMGEDYAREATDAEIRAMRREVGAAMAAGAIGLSINKLPRHVREDGSPLPSRYADDREILALAAEVGRFCTGVIQTPSQGYRRLAAEARWHGDLALATGRPVIWGVVQHRWSEPNQWRDMLATIDEEVRRGARLYSLTPTQPITRVHSLANSNQFDDLPTWKDVLHRPIEERKRALADPEIRRRLRYEALEDPTPTGFSKRWDLVYLAGASLPQYRPFLRKSIAEIARAQGKDVIDAFLDLSLAENLEATIESANIQGDPDAVQDMLRDLHVLLGISDAGAHATEGARFGYCTWLLGHWVRERQVISLEEAVHRLTFAVAAVYDLPDRGLLRPGYAADVVALDPARVDCGELEWVTDMPGGQGRYIQRAQGVELTLVNGQVLIEGGEDLGACGGRIVRNRCARPARPRALVGASRP